METILCPKCNTPMDQYIDLVMEGNMLVEQNSWQCPNCDKEAAK